jgi:hypothetical protein
MGQFWLHVAVFVLKSTWTPITKLYRKTESIAVFATRLRVPFRALAVFGAFAPSREAPLTFVMSVRPSVDMYQRGSHWKDFREIWCLRLLRIYVEKLKIWLKSDTLPKYVLLLPATLSRHKTVFSCDKLSGCKDSRGGINIRRTCLSVTLYLNCLPCFVLFDWRAWGNQEWSKRDEVHIT